MVTRKPKLILLAFVALLGVLTLGVVGADDDDVVVVEDDEPSGFTYTDRQNMEPSSGSSAGSEETEEPDVQHAADEVQRAAADEPAESKIDDTLSPALEPWKHIDPELLVPVPDDVDHPWKSAFLAPKEYIHDQFMLTLVTPENANNVASKLLRAAKRNWKHLNATQELSGMKNRTLLQHQTDVNYWLNQTRIRSSYSYMIESPDGKAMNGLFKCSRPDFDDTPGAPVYAKANQQWPAGPRTMDCYFWVDEKQIKTIGLDIQVVKAVCEWVDDDWPVDILVFTVKPQNKRQIRIMKEAKLKSFDVDFGDYESMFSKTFWHQREGIDVDLTELPLAPVEDPMAKLEQFKDLRGIDDDEKTRLDKQMKQYELEAKEAGFCSGPSCDPVEIMKYFDHLKQQAVGSIESDIYVPDVVRNAAELAEAFAFEEKEKEQAAKAEEARLEELNGDMDSVEDDAANASGGAGDGAHTEL